MKASIDVSGVCLPAKKPTGALGGHCSCCCLLLFLVVRLLIILVFHTILEIEVTNRHNLNPSVICNPGEIDGQQSVALDVLD